MKSHFPLILAALFVVTGCTDISKRRKRENPYEEYSLWKDTDKIEEPLEPYIPEATEVTLKELMDAFRPSNPDLYKMHAKYSQSILKVTGRTNGLNEEGHLRLQVKPFDDVIFVKGINDHEFLMNVKEDDIVEVIGYFERKKKYSGHSSEFTQIYSVKIIQSK